MTIRIITCGGTIDAQSIGSDGQYVFSESKVPLILSQGRFGLDYELEHLMSVDSQHMSLLHRQCILESCISAPENRILIIHGTDTMIETARFLAKAFIDKTIVLTGAMVPYNCSDSDALFNVGSALAYLQVLPRALFVVMNGQVFDPYRVSKDNGRGIFVGA